MKKLLLAMAILFLCQAAQAQTSLKVGLKAGLTYSSLAGDAAQYTNSKNSNNLFLRTDKVDGLLGIHAGAFALVSVSDKFSLKPEILYSGKGYAFTQSRESVEKFGDKVEEEYKFRSNYLDVPLLVQWNISNFYLEAGPSISFLVAANATHKQTFTNPEWTEPATEEKHTTTSSTSGTRRVSAGYALGAGYQLPNGLDIGIRYSSDLTSLAKHEYNGETPNVRNSGAQFSLAYTLWRK